MSFYGIGGTALGALHSLAGTSRVFNAARKALKIIQIANDANNIYYTLNRLKRTANDAYSWATGTNVPNLSPNDNLTYARHLHRIRIFAPSGMLSAECPDASGTR